MFCWCTARTPRPPKPTLHTDQTGGRQEFLVELKKGKVAARTTIMTVTGPDGRWLVEDVDVTRLKDFCS